MCRLEVSVIGKYCHPPPAMARKLPPPAASVAVARSQPAPASGYRGCFAGCKLPSGQAKSCQSLMEKFIQKFCLYIQNFCLYKQNFCFYFASGDNRLFVRRGVIFPLSISVLRPSSCRAWPGRRWRKVYLDKVQIATIRYFGGYAIPENGYICSVKQLT